MPCNSVPVKATATAMLLSQETLSPITQYNRKQTRNSIGVDVSTSPWATDTAL